MMIRLICCAFFALLPLLCPAQDTALRVGDPVDIRIGGVPSEEAAMINNTYNVDGSGSINLPHIGRVKAAGLTTAQLSQSIQSTYIGAGIFTNPTIAIAQQAASRFVTVGGEVRAPQRVPYTPDLTVFSAIQAAGGFSEYADRKKVRLMSGRKSLVIDTAVILKDPTQDIKLAPGDQITVPSTPW